LGYLLLWCCCCCLLLGLREVGGERGRGKIFLRCEKKVGGEPGCGRRAAGGRWPHPKYPAVRSRHVARLVEGSRPRVRRPAGRGGSEASGDDAGGRGRAREKTSERDTRAHEAQLQARRPQLTIWPTCQQILFFSKSTFGWAKSARFTQGQTDFFFEISRQIFLLVRRGGTRVAPVLGHLQLLAVQHSCKISELCGPTPSRLRGCSRYTLVPKYLHLLTSALHI
jgi:hypothetical protein